MVLPQLALFATSCEAAEVARAADSVEETKVLAIRLDFRGEPCTCLATDHDFAESSCVEFARQ
jgi:hypothetical protein